MNNLKQFIERLLEEIATEPGDQPPAGPVVETLLTWPPDVFALTSIILKQTGAYVFSVLPLETWPDEGWEARIETARQQWYGWIADPERSWAGRETLHSFVTALADDRLEQVSLEDLRRLVDVPAEFAVSADGVLERIDGEPVAPDQPHHATWRAWRICRAILDLHALSDEICRGFGTPSGNQWTRTPEICAGNLKTIHCIANLLLAYTGSLSQLPTTLGIVLPKMRTPATGLTLRSLSHHLTFHATEVDVLWRTLPWVDIDENTLNMLVVPWPYRVEATWFKPSVSTTNRRSQEQTRYFEYTGGGEQNRFPVADLLEMLDEAERSVNRIHLIVFPEQALTEGERDAILAALAQRAERDGTLDRTRVPMLLTGLRAGESMDPSGPAKTTPHGSNKVVLSTFFAGKWYQLGQNKHHRWRLSEAQIWQYGLGGALSANRNWWEAIDLPRRKLTVLAPNSWFSLCPLICEDLARQEPIADLIRGVGPTMLIAVLLDGPQLRERWAGRYASVLADDPGSSVLSVSALGLTRRSRAADGRVGSPQVALWKDSERGWWDVNLEGERGGVVLTVDARWKLEFAADGRADEDSAAVLVMSGAHPIVLPPRDRGAPAVTAQAEFTSTHPTPIASSDDLLEISLFSFFVDAVLDCEAADFDRIDLLHQWLLGEPGSETVLPNLHPLRARLARAAGRLFPGRQGDYVTKGPEQQPDIDNLIPFLSWFCDLIKRVKRDQGCVTAGGFRRLLDYIEAILGEVARGHSFISAVLHDRDPFPRLRAEGFDLPALIPPASVVRAEDRHIRVRICLYSCLAILWAVHRRLAILRRYGRLSGDDIRLLNRIEELLKQDYDRVWAEAIVQARQLQAGVGV